MKLVKRIQAATIAVFLCAVTLLGGCSTIETLGDFVKENPVKASFAFRYATATFIERGSTEEQRQARAEEVERVGNDVLAYIDSNPRISTNSVMSYLDSRIDWGSLNTADRILVMDILTIVESELSTHEIANPLINVRELLETIVSAAVIYAR